MRKKVYFILLSILFIYSSCFYREYRLNYFLSHSDNVNRISIFKKDSLQIDAFITSEHVYFKDKKTSNEIIKEQFKNTKVGGFKLSFYIDRKNKSVYQLRNVNLLLIQKYQDKIKEYPLIEENNLSNIISYNSPDTIKNFKTDALFYARFNVDSIGMTKSSYALRYNLDLFVDKLKQRLEGEVDLNLSIQSLLTTPIR
jgi:hypothetical protein